MALVGWLYLAWVYLQYSRRDIRPAKRFAPHKPQFPHCSTFSVPSSISKCPRNYSKWAPTMSAFHVPSQTHRKSSTQPFETSRLPNNCQNWWRDFLRIYWSKKGRRRGSVRFHTNLFWPSHIRSAFRITRSSTASRSTLWDTISSIMDLQFNYSYCTSSLIFLAVDTTQRHIRIYIYLVNLFFIKLIAYLKPRLKPQTPQSPPVLDIRYSIFDMTRRPNHRQELGI